MSANATNKPSWQTLNQSISGFRGECNELDKLVEALFDQAAQLHEELAGKSGELEIARNGLAQRERQLAEQKLETERLTELITHQEQRFSDKLGELQQAQQLLLERFDATRSVEAELAEARASRDQTAVQLDEARTEISRLAGVTQELATARQEIADLQERLGTLQTQAAQQPRKDQASNSELLELLKQQESQWVERLEEALLEHREQSAQDAAGTEENRATAAEAERDQLRQQLAEAQQRFADFSAATDKLDALHEEIVQLRAAVPAESTSIDISGNLDAAIRELLQQHDTNLQDRLLELRQLQSRLLDRTRGWEAVLPTIDSLQATEALQKEVSRIGRLAEQWHEQVLGTRKDVAKLNDAVAPWTVIRDQLNEVNRRLDALGDLPTGEEADPQLVLELEQERGALEAELQLVRARAAELYETVSTQQRELAEQRQSTTDELGRLRQLLEAGSAVAPAAPEPAPPAPEAPVAAAPPEPTESDPVVSSVMAQFAKLQKDVAKRRKKQ